jgi:UDP-N-acetylmuramate dehydrogenase
MIKTHADDDMTQGNGWRRSEPLSKHTSWRVGGPADLYCKPASLAELEQRLRDLPPEIRVHWIGLGSNLLVRDGGIRGAVIATGSLPKGLERLDGGLVKCGAGLPCALLARQCARWQLGPAAFFAGIPGSVGGALAMNAGAFGGETWSVVDSVVTIDRRGVLRTRPAADYAVAYRTVRGPQSEWFVGAVFRLRPDTQTTPATIKALLAKRAATQPLGVPSGGSTFRNPPGDFAGRLIEQAGLKGARVGGAVVSAKHANFILNEGAATAADIERLIELVAAMVLERCGVRLELEVRIVGEPAAGGRA